MIRRGNLLLLSLVGFACLGRGASLTNERVQRAVDQALAWTKKGGVARVTGIQEFTQQNQARADISFEGFQYNANNFDLPQPKDEVTPPEPDVHSPTFYQDMANLPARQRHIAQYSGQGAALLKHYNDGRWVLTQIQFNFVEVNSNIEITPDVPGSGRGVTPPRLSVSQVGGAVTDDKYSASLRLAEERYIHDGGRPLFLAAMQGKVAEMQRILSTGTHVDAIDNFGWTSLAYAARHGRGEAVRFLIEKRADVNRRNGWNDTTALILASYHGRTEIVTLLLKAGADANAADAQGTTPLSEASAEGHSEIVALLRKAGAAK